MRLIHGITGSVASVLYPKLNFELSKIGDVDTVSTKSALKFLEVTDEIYTDDDEWNAWDENQDVLHIELRRNASLLLIAPLSANTLAKMANGICDDLLTCIVRAWDINRPLIVAPSMNTLMWDNPLTDKHLADIEKIYHAIVVQPISKELKCGDFGVGAMSEIDIITDVVKSKLRWISPLNRTIFIPTGNHPGSFGCKRKHDVHTGVDLYCCHGDVVRAVEDGKVVSIGPFTGPQAGSDWWKDTSYIMVEGPSGVINYGEIEVLCDKSHVKKGEIIGRVKQVLPDDKIRMDIPHHSCSMLHMELYIHGTNEPVIWPLNDEKPKNLKDPTNLLNGFKD